MSAEPAEEISGSMVTRAALAFVAAAVVALGVLGLAQGGLRFSAAFFAHDFVLDGKTWVVIALLVLAERLWPLSPGTRVLRPSYASDLVWFVGSFFFAVIIAETWTRAMGSVFEHQLSFLTLPLDSVLPRPVLIVLALLVGDLLGWVNHWAHHRFEFLWRFHAVHHSAVDMNIFTDGRYHVVEYLVSGTLIFIPFFVIGGDWSAGVVLLVFLLRWHRRAYHAAIRTNLGPLRYVIVSPQSHRVHHSYEKGHIGTNLGINLSIWDRLFGTASPNHDVYPACGIQSADYPSEPGRSPIGIVGSVVAQHRYPFRKVAT